MESVKADLHHIHDLIEVGEHLVAYIVLADVFPDVFGRIQIRAVGWERNQRHIGRDDKVVRLMPTRAIEEHHAMFSGKLGSCVRQEHRHHLGVHERQDH